jgi:hypothetical protein
MTEHHSTCKALTHNFKCDCHAAYRKHLHDAIYHSLVFRLANAMEAYHFDLNDVLQAAYLANDLLEQRKIKK